jgi:hypothetical protein
MPLSRKTAILQFTLPGDAAGAADRQVESKPLTCEREYGALLAIDGAGCPAQFFQSPRNDEQWRDFVQRLRDCNVNRDENGYRGAVFIRSIGADLYRNLAALSPRLRDFLDDFGTPRRLVIQSRRPELHLLPWSALYDDDGRFLAAGDLSIVQSWDGFSDAPNFLPANPNLVVQLRPDTPKNTAPALQALPMEWDRNAARDADILSVEAHGNAVTNEIGEVGPWATAEKFGKAKLALLWSCYSSAANSWGESPALCLHRLGAAMVLSFQAELHNEDAKSIAAALFSDVFGAAASRDPESALVRIRADKFQREFAYGAWASMTVYLRGPLDLTALPLNGPRVPAQGWSDDDVASSDAWEQVSAAVGSLQPGAHQAFPGPTEAFSKLPKQAFASWNGTIIRLDGADNPVSDACLEELGLSRKEAPSSHPAARLAWFFGKIARYGSPLIVWTNASPRHRDFLRASDAASALSFLLLYKPDAEPSLPELVDENRLAEARERAFRDPPPTGEAGDDYWSAAYFAFARGDDPARPCRVALGNLGNPAEKLLLLGNYASRFGAVLDETEPPANDLEAWQRAESYYRQALGQAVEANNLREIGRAKLELGYLLQAKGEAAAAEIAYRAATEALERSQLRDTRWHSALGRVLRDRADLLCKQPEQRGLASALLGRAFAIHAYHGRHLQVAYCQTTAAHIHLAGGDCAQAVLSAMDAANAFEACAAWHGWGEAIQILLDALAAHRETGRMIGVADLAIQKANRAAVPTSVAKKLTVVFTLKKAQALFTAGDFTAARSELVAVPTLDSPELQAEADRLRRFLAI